MCKDARYRVQDDVRTTVYIIGRAGASPSSRTPGAIFYICRSCPIPHISKCFYVFLFMRERTVEYRELEIEGRVRFDCQFNSATIWERGPFLAAIMFTARFSTSYVG